MTPLQPSAGPPVTATARAAATGSSSGKRCVGDLTCVTKRDASPHFCQRRNVRCHIPTVANPAGCTPQIQQVRQSPYYKMSNPKKIQQYKTQSGNWTKQSRQVTQSLERHQLTNRSPTLPYIANPDFPGREVNHAVRARPIKTVYRTAHTDAAVSQHERNPSRGKDPQRNTAVTHTLSGAIVPLPMNHKDKSRQFDLRCRTMSPIHNAGWI